MTQDYPTYYKQCQKIFSEQEKTTDKNSLYDIGLQHVNPYAKDNIIQVSKNYLDIIHEISMEANDRFKNKKEIYIPENVNPQKENLARLKNPLSISKINELADIIFPQIEHKLFNSYIHLSHLYIYRSVVNSAQPDASWLWHYDNYPVEIHKVIIYLTDVNEDSGPFEYLLDRENKPIIVQPSRTGEDNWNKPKWKGSRVPEKIMKRYREKGSRIKTITGKIGNMIVFDNNCIHRAKKANKQHRDVISFQIKPYQRPLKPFISHDWTVSFQNRGVYPLPDMLKNVA